MGVIQTVFSWFVTNILSKPEFFVGLIVLIGYLLLKKTWYESIAGFLKAVVGYMILNVGADGLVTTFRPILAGLRDRFHLSAAVIDPYFGLNAVNEALKTIGLTTSWTMTALLIGFIFNILLVLARKLTKMRALFITGHIMVQQATTIAWIVFFTMPNYRNVVGAIIIGALVGLYWAVASNLTIGITQDLTGGAGFAIGHQQMLGVWLAAKLAPKIGNKKKNIESLKLPGWLEIFNDNTVSTSILMTLFFGIIMTVLGQDYLQQTDAANFTAGLSFPIYIFSKSLSFAVYLSILMSGVRMFVSELTQSFQGISNKILPGAVPAVDVAATYGFAPANVVLFGFIVGAIGQFIAIMGLIVFHSPVLIITGFVPVFFDNAAIAVFANKFGGTRAAVILSFFAGIIEVLGGAFAAMFFDLSKFGGWHGSIDFELMWPWVGVLFKYAGIIGVIIVVLLMFAVPQLQYHFAKDKQAYNEGLQ